MTAVLAGRMSTCPGPIPRSSARTSWPSPAAATPRSGRSRRTSGISESCLRNWLRAADVEDGNRPGVTASESAELRELRRRNRLLEQENEVLRKAGAYLSQAVLPGPK
jgi:transposase